MKFLLALVPALLLAPAVQAQQVPEDAQRDLWCGIAFSLVAAEVPPGATPEQQTTIKQFLDGGSMLIERARAAHVTAGYTDESFAAHRTALESEVKTQISTTEGNATYTFEECSGLLQL